VPLSLPFSRSVSLSAMKASPKPAFKPYEGPEDVYESRCPVCGVAGRFVRERQSVTESYQCATCRGALRYQGQARAILREYARHGAESIAELVAEPEFQRVQLFEPGDRGPFRKYFRNLDGYVWSLYDPSAAPGETRNGARHEDLMQLSFESESIDLVVTSDIFEHVRHPERAFAEVLRVLRPGGAHIFTIPGRWPLRDTTVPRVDVSGAEDVSLLPKVFHNGEHLVYNDFGRDLLDLLDGIGFRTDPIRFESTSETASSQVTFCCVRPSH
jgi:SAM-dependent methyltransferase